MSSRKIASARHFYSHFHNNVQELAGFRAVAHPSNSGGPTVRMRPHSPEVVISEPCIQRKKYVPTSELMIITKTLLRMSVFIPCFLASFNRSFSGLAVVVSGSGFLDSNRSTKGLPRHAARTSHHFPFVSASRRSFNETRKGS